MLWQKAGRWGTGRRPPHAFLHFPPFHPLLPPLLSRTELVSLCVTVSVFPDVNVEDPALKLPWFDTRHVALFSLWAGGLST